MLPLPICDSISWLKKKKLAYLILELVQGVGGDYGRGGVEPLHRHSSELGQVGEVDGPECAPA